MKKTNNTFFAFLFLALVQVTISAAEEHIEPWLPQHLDDWDATVAEVKEYVKTYNEAHAKIEGQFKFKLEIRSVPITMFGSPISPPTDAAPSDVISCFYFGGEEHATRSCGVIQIWRALHKGAAGAVVMRRLSEDPKRAPFPDFTEQIPLLEAQTVALKPPTGTWNHEVQKDGLASTWYATWLRTDDRARVKDDSEQDPNMLKPMRESDRQWLVGPPPPVPPSLPLVSAQPMTPESYVQRVAAHPAIQRGLNLYRAGVPSRYRVICEKVNEEARALGIKTGDMVFTAKGPLYFNSNYFQSIWDHMPDKPIEIILVRPGIPPLTVAVTKNSNVQFRAMESAPDPGLAVLAAVAEVNKDLVPNAAAAMYALDFPDLGAEGLKRLESQVPQMTLAFIRAWQAAAAGDFGLADRILAIHTARVPDSLMSEIQLFRRFNRERSGRIYWARPNQEKTPGFAVIMRRLVNSVPENERFALFEGTVTTSLFPLDAADQWHPDGRAANLFSPVGGSLVSTHDDRWQPADISNIPERCEIRCDFTIAPTDFTNSKKDVAPPNPYLQIEFVTQSTALITGDGAGHIHIHPNGRVTCVAPKILPIDMSDGYAYEPVPVFVNCDGVTLNSLRIVRMGECERVDINGHVVMQGFLPLLNPPGTPNAQTIGLSLIAQDVVCTFKNGRVFRTKDLSEKSNF